MPLIKDPIKRDRNAQLIFGCDEVEAIEINAGRPLRERGSLAMAYVTQRHAAHRRGICWEITFKEWLTVWRESGFLAVRGVGVGSYCMARHGDTGPYSPHNVSIIPTQQNSFDGGFGGKARHALSRPQFAGRGRGWCFVRGKYQVMVGPKYIGRFATQSEAESAYQSACAIHNASKGFASSHDPFFVLRSLSEPFRQPRKES